MRTRWIAGIFAVSALALGTAVSLAQRPDRPTLAIQMAPKEVAGDRKPWRPKAELEVAGPSAPPANQEPPVAIEVGPAAEDPMLAVDSFLRRNRKEADDSIQALTREADALRARLAKVEAALARWQAVAGALHPGQKWAQPEAPTEHGPDLRPIDPPTGNPKPTADSPSPLDPVVIPAPGRVVSTPGVEPPPTLPDPSPALPPAIPPPGPGVTPEPK